MTGILLYFVIRAQRGVGPIAVAAARARRALGHWPVSWALHSFGRLNAQAHTRKSRDRARDPKGEDAGGGFDRSANRAWPEGVAMIQGKPQPSGRIGVIDELRGLALVMVVLSHVGLVYGLETDNAYSLALPAFGVGVDLFFDDLGFCDLLEGPGDECQGCGEHAARRASVLGAAVRENRCACRRHPRSGWSGSTGAGVPSSVMGRSRRGSRVLREFLLGGLHGEPGPLPASVGRLAFSESIARRTILRVRASAHRLAPPPGLAGLPDCCCDGRGLGTPCWVLCLEHTTGRPVFIGIGLATSREQAVARRKLWPSLSLGQAFYWACVASLFARLTIGRFSGLSLTLVAVLFGFVLAGRAWEPSRVTLGPRWRCVRAESCRFRLTWCTCP